MNPLKYFVLIAKDIWDDIKFLPVLFRKIVRREQLVDPEKWETFKNEFKFMTAEEFFKATWPYIIAVLFAFFMGWMVGETKAQVDCNNFIIENFYNTTDQYVLGSQYLNLSPELPLISSPPDSPSKKESYG